jgi:cytochrome c oxidase subunit 2
VIDAARLLRRLVFLPDPASTAAGPIDGLHGFLLAITILGMVPIGVITVVSLFRYSHRTPPRDEPRERRAHPLFEASTIVGITVLFVGVWVVGFGQFVELRTPPPEASTVYVTAKQWVWKFAYPDGTESVGQLVVPRGHPVRLVMTSRDVIHSWFVPAFRLKHDVLPGRTTFAWFEATEAGRFPLWCAELCGQDHARMAAEVVVLEPDAYARWKDDETRREIGEGTPDMAAVGRTVAARKGCLACHTATGESGVGPTWVGAWGATVRLSDGREVVADEAYLTRSMMEPDVDVVAGFEPVMPSFQGQLDAFEVAALLEYVRALRSGPDEGLP